MGHQKTALSNFQYGNDGRIFPEHVPKPTTYPSPLEKALNITSSPSSRNFLSVPFNDTGFCPFHVSSNKHPKESGSCTEIIRLLMLNTGLTYIHKS
uniref:Uncharacterized protein n=1 Tax=Rhizophora mucronata TaxID=61149 RepID=A0A2P2LIL2_RHIMU